MTKHAKQPQLGWGFLTAFGASPAKVARIRRRRGKGPKHYLAGMIAIQAKASRASERAAKAFAAR